MEKNKERSNFLKEGPQIKGCQCTKFITGVCGPHLKANNLPPPHYEHCGLKHKMLTFYYFMCHNVKQSEILCYVHTVHLCVLNGIQTKKKPAFISVC
jgi:hypothetical protein